MNKKEQEIIKIICEHPDAYHNCILAFIEYINAHNFNRTHEITIQRLEANREAFINEIKNQLDFINLNFLFSNSNLNESALIDKGIMLEQITDQIAEDAHNFYDFSDFSLKNFFAKYDIIQEYLSMESIVAFKLPHDTTDLEKLIIKSFMQHDGAFEMIKQEFDTNLTLYHTYKQLMSNIKKLSDITGIAIDCSNYNNLDDFRNINQHELENNYSDSKNNARIILNMLLDPEQFFNRVLS